jgi:hypothetical protein
MFVYTDFPGRNWRPFRFAVVLGVFFGLVVFADNPSGGWTSLLSLIMGMFFFWFIVLFLFTVLYNWLSPTSNWEEKEDRKGWWKL